MAPSMNKKNVNLAWVRLGGVLVCLVAVLVVRIVAFSRGGEAGVTGVVTSPTPGTGLSIRTVGTGLKIGGGERRGLE